MEASRVDTRVHKSVNTDESNEHDRLYRFRLDPCDHFSKFLHLLLLIKIISLSNKLIVCFSTFEIINQRTNFIHTVLDRLFNPEEIER